MDGNDENAQGGRSSIIERIYELLDGVERDIRDLKSVEGRRQLDVAYMLSICEAAQFLADRGYFRRLGVPDQEASKFLAYKGRVWSDVAAKVGERIISLLHEVEGVVAKELDPPIDNSLTAPVPAEGTSLNMTFTAASWVVVRPTNAELISTISELIDEALVLARSTNLPPEQRALSAVERAQLVAILETALHVLKAPLVEKGLIKQLKTAAQEGATNALKKKTELALGYGLGKLVEVLAKLMELL